MKTLPAFRAAHLFPHLNLLRTIGAPVESELKQVKLPITLGHQPDTLLPLLPAVNFLIRMANREGIDDLELRAVHVLKMEDLSNQFIQALQLTPTLYAALNTFINFVTYEANYVNYWMVKEESTATVYGRFNASNNARTIRCSEWNQVMGVIGVVRAFAGPTWCPAEIGLQSSLPVGEYAIECFPNTRIVTGLKASYIQFPGAMLSMSLPKQLLATDKLQAGNEPLIDNATHFPGSLKAVLKSYFGDGYPDIKLAADIAGTSVRTLQRQLKQYGVRYSDLVDQSRFESAVELLKNPDISNLDVAYAVGYEDPSNFARAFRRLAGVSPKEYRSQLLLSA